MAQPPQKNESDGFAGAVSGMSLADIIQVKGNNRDSGCLVIEHFGKTGTIILCEGEVVHAEQGKLAGEEAFYEIMCWKGGTFRTEPLKATPRKTIDQNLSFLLLEAFRRIDEAKNGLPSTVQATNSGKESGVMSDIHTKLKAIPDVEQAVIITKDGAVVDDTSYEAEFLGAHGLFLALFAGQVGSQFGIGDLKDVTVHGSEHHLFLFDSKRHHLLVSAKGNGNVGAVDAEIRRALAQK